MVPGSFVLQRVAWSPHRIKMAIHAEWLLGGCLEVLMLELLMLLMRVSRPCRRSAPALLTMLPCFAPAVPEAGRRGRAAGTLGVLPDLGHGHGAAAAAAAAHAAAARTSRRSVDGRLSSSGAGVAPRDLSQLQAAWNSSS